MSRLLNLLLSLSFYPLCTSSNIEADLRSSNLEILQVGPQEFMDREVVIVAINYRLGPIGFLSMGTEEVPGKLILI